MFLDGIRNYKSIARVRVQAKDMTVANDGGIETYLLRFNGDYRYFI